MPRQVLSEASIEYLRTLLSTDFEPFHHRRILSVSTYSSSADSEATIELPEYLDSHETLLYCDLSPEVATIIWSAYQRQVEDFGEDQIDLLETICTFIESRPVDAFAENEGWENVLQELGANGDMSKRILDPYWVDVRLLQSAKEWVVFIVRERLVFLESLNSLFKSCADRARQTGPAQSETSVSSSRTVRTSSTSTMQSLPPVGTFKAASSPHTTSGATTQGNPAEESRTFFKGGTMARLRVGEGPGGRIERLRSMPPGDFSGEIGGLYFTKHRQVAWEYAQRVAHFVDGRATIPVAVLSIEIPNDLLSATYQLVGPEWRTFVYLNRRGELEKIAAEFSHVHDFDWLEGPVCGQETAVVERMESAEELQVMKLGLGSAHQFWTGKQPMYQKLQQRSQSSVVLEQVHPTRKR